MYFALAATAQGPAIYRGCLQTAGQTPARSFPKQPGLLRACPCDSFFDAEWAEIEIFDFGSDRLQAGRIGPERLENNGSIPQFHLEVLILGDLIHDFFGDSVTSSRSSCQHARKERGWGAALHYRQKD